MMGERLHTGQARRTAVGTSSLSSLAARVGQKSPVPQVSNGAMVRALQRMVIGTGPAEDVQHLTAVASPSLRQLGVDVTNVRAIQDWQQFTATAIDASDSDPIVVLCNNGMNQQTRDSIEAQVQNLRDMGMQHTVFLAIVRGSHVDIDVMDGPPRAAPVSPAVTPAMSAMSAAPAAAVSAAARPHPRHRRADPLSQQVADVINAGKHAKANDAAAQQMAEVEAQLKADAEAELREALAWPALVLPSAPASAASAFPSAPASAASAPAGPPRFTPAAAAARPVPMAPPNTPSRAPINLFERDFDNFRSNIAVGAGYARSGMFHEAVAHGSVGLNGAMRRYSITFGENVIQEAADALLYVMKYRQAEAQHSPETKSHVDLFLIAAKRAVDVMQQKLSGRN